MPEWVDISRSSWLEAAKYDPESRSMFLRLDTGAEIEVLDVRPNVWRRFLGAASRGRFFHRVISPNHVKRVL